MRVGRLVGLAGVLDFVAVRLAGDGDLEGAVAGKPDCYGIGWVQRALSFFSIASISKPPISVPKALSISRMQVGLVTLISVR